MFGAKPKKKYRDFWQIRGVFNEMEIAFLWSSLSEREIQIRERSDSSICLYCNTLHTDAVFNLYEISLDIMISAVYVACDTGLHIILAI